MKVAVAMLLVGLGLGLGVTAQERRGAVSGVTWKPGLDVGTIQFRVAGANPCGAVQIEFADGTQGITYPIAQLPATVTREFTSVGTFPIRARGVGSCDGAATTEIRVLRVRPQPETAPPPPPPQTAGTRPAIRFANMDTNGDGVIIREEWRGSARSFELHDWNRDDRLAANEVEVGATWPVRSGNPASFNDWSRERFTWLDRNGDSRISRSEWSYDVEDFFRVDRDGDSFLALREFLVGDEDDDRGDRFVDLDLNRDGRIDRSEWHGSPSTFTRLDRDRDGVLTRVEAAGKERR